MEETMRLLDKLLELDSQEAAAAAALAADDYEGAVQRTMQLLEDVSAAGEVVDPGTKVCAECRVPAAGEVVDPGTKVCAECRVPAAGEVIGTSLPASLPDRPPHQPAPSAALPTWHTPDSQTAGAAGSALGLSAQAGRGSGGAAERRSRRVRPGARADARGAMPGLVRELEPDPRHPHPTPIPSSTRLRALVARYCARRGQAARPWHSALGTRCTYWSRRGWGASAG